MTAFERTYAAMGARAALTLPAWIVGFSFLGIGSLARDAGHPVGAAMLSTFLINAAPAQLILYTAIASGGLLVPAAIAVLLSAIRLFPMTLSLLPYLSRPGQPWYVRSLLAHPVAATIWVEAMRKLPDMPPEGRVPYYAAFATVVMTVCTTMTGIGFALVGALPKPLAIGLLGLTPIYFTIIMVGGARSKGDYVAVALGLGLLPVASIVLGRNFDILAAGLAAGTLAYGADRVLRRTGRVR